MSFGRARASTGAAAGGRWPDGEPDGLVETSALGSRAWSVLLRAMVAVAAVSGAACGQNNGTAQVAAVVEVLDCRPGGKALERGPLSFDAGFVGTQRFEDTLIIRIQEFSVDLEETDGVDILLTQVSALSAAPRPTSVPIAGDESGVHAALNLFSTCPDRPTLHAVAGTLTLDVFEIAEDPDNTGIDERIAGSITATVVGVDHVTVAGTFEASFDFRPGKISVAGPR